MLRFAVRRLLSAIPTLLVIITAAFFLMRVAPGGPFDEEQAIPPEIHANLEAAYGLDQPVFVQFGNYLAGLLRGDLGPSFKYRDFRVSELIARGLPVTLTVGGLALLLALAAGVPLGMLAALRQNGPVDHTVMALALVGIAVPSFVVAPVLALVFGVRLQWLPVAGWEPGGLRYLVLPVVTLALPFIAYLARLARGSLLEVLQSPFIRTARAKGLGPGYILRRHALKPTLLPVLSFLGPATAALLTGSLVVEQVFGLPGVGRYFVQGAINRDYTLVMGMVIFYAMLIVLLNLAVDMLYGWLDPRIRHG
ncbi:MAG TPA: oligopeptide ABC transporter permease OppB [Steroidobacteraceae bacterium]|nr:oligopeptide ABC transporter permease OppB [Steroidobacteraceae bacterium]